ncbi:MAG: flagellin domain protein [Thermoleophilia bacterium]|nr:flagellin domain protein [Thermoleophilia bacterium]
MHRHLALSSSRMSQAMQRLSSGLRINSAADDAAGLGISERMRGQISGLEQATRNIQDGMSLVDTMEAALSEVHSILQRARQIAVQFNNDTYSFEDKQNMATELMSLSDEIARIEDSTTFNGISLLQSATAVVTLQVGANTGETIAVSLVDLFGPGLNLVRPVSFFTLPWLPADIAGLDLHIDDVSQARARLGAISNRLEYARSANLNQQEQLMGAESRIRDADMAAEMTQLVRQQVLQQSGTKMLGIANQSAARVLDLLR